MTIKTQYMTAVPFLNGVALPPQEQGLAKWLDEENAQRLAAYDLYDDIYQNNPNTYVMLLRGNEERPIYIPSARRIVNTMNRYVARGFNFTLGDADPAATVPAEQLAQSVLMLESFFTRERFNSKFNAAKRKGLTRGDFCLFIYANPLKPEGQRISIKSIHPKTVFPMRNDDGSVIGYDIVERFVDSADDKTRIRRQRYLKGSNPLHPAFGTANEAEASIQYSMVVLEEKGWQSEVEQEITRTEVPLIEIAGITQLPVYHFKNNDDFESAFGYSELAGIEHIIAGVNQGSTDLDISLSMAGLGMYWTDSGSPKNDDGTDGDWVIGPRRVVEVTPGSKFDRVSGITSSDPALSHISYLEETMDSTFGISDVVTGRADVAVAESGIALALRMGPILDAAEEKDTIINDVLTQMFFDLRQWFDVYEKVNMDTLSITPTWGDKMPRNRDAEFNELMTLFGENLITAEYLLNALNEKFGYDFTPAMVKEIVEQKKAMADTLNGNIDDRIGQEAGEEEGNDDEGGDGGEN